MRFTFRVKKHPDDPTQDVITEARYLTFGCTSAIASSEALCMLLGEQTYTPITALEIKNEDIVKYLGGLPRQKIHCSVMGAEALEAAVFNWAQKRKVDLSALGVEMALSGHTHRNRLDPQAVPCDVKTDNVCDGARAYRLIRVSGGTLQPELTSYAGSDGGNLRVAVPRGPRRHYGDRGLYRRLAQGGWGDHRYRIGLLPVRCRGTGGGSLHHRRAEPSQYRGA
jgi:hypothetical protein